MLSGLLNYFDAFQSHFAAAESSAYAAIDLERQDLMDLPALLTVNRRWPTWAAKQPQSPRH